MCKSDGEKDEVIVKGDDELVDVNKRLHIMIILTYILIKTVLLAESKTISWT